MGERGTIEHGAPPNKVTDPMQLMLVMPMLGGGGGDAAIVDVTTVERGRKGC